MAKSDVQLCTISSPIDPSTIHDEQKPLLALSFFPLRWCYTGQLATSTCNADSQRMFFARICRHVTLLNRFQKLATRYSTANIAKNRPQRGVTPERFFAQHRITASWRCKLTSVTPPLAILDIPKQQKHVFRSAVTTRNDEFKAVFHSLS